MKRLGIFFALTVQGLGAINSEVQWHDLQDFCMGLRESPSPIKVQSRNEFVDGGSALIDWVVRQHDYGPVDYENFQSSPSEQTSSQKDTASPTDSVQPLGGRPRFAQASAFAKATADKMADRSPGSQRLTPKSPAHCLKKLSTHKKLSAHTELVEVCPSSRPGQHPQGKTQNLKNVKKAAVFKSMLQQSSSISQVKLLYTNYCSQLDNHLLNPANYQLIDKRVRALKATLDHPGQIQERNIKFSAQERAELLKSGVSAAALASLRGSAAQLELHEEYTSVFEQWAQKSHEIRRSLVQESIAQITLQFADLADECNRSNNLAGSYAMADVMHAAWQSVQEFFTLAKATAQVDYEVLGILGASALDGALCAGCSTAQAISHPVQTLKALGSTIARVAYTADILLGNDKQRSAQTRAELYAMLKAAANELSAKAQSQHPLMTFSDCVSGGTQFVAEGVLASKCMTLSANVLSKSAQALNKLPELAKTAGTKIRLPLTGPQRELALAHAQASIGEGFIEEMARAQTGISGARRSPIVATPSRRQGLWRARVEEGRRRVLKQEQEAVQKIPAQQATPNASAGLQSQKPSAQPTTPVSPSGLQPAVPGKPSVTTAFPGPLPAPGTQQLLKVFALPEQQRAAIIARYGKPIPEIGGGQFKNPLHLIAIDVRKIDQKTGIVKEWMGFHHDYQHVFERNNVITLTEKQNLGGGFYKAKPIYGTQIPKWKSFFPAEWPPEKVFEKVIEAHNNIKDILPARGGRKELIGWLEHEQKAISIIVDDNKDIITAYPNFSYRGR